MSDVHICFCSDVNLVNYIYIVLNSIISHTTSNIIVHYIHNITDESRLDALMDFVNKHDGLILKTYFKAWNALYTGLKHVTEATMLRLYIPDIVMVSKLLYLDIDVIVNVDVKEIYNMHVDEILMKSSIRSPDGKTILKTKTKKSGNCGVMLMNLDNLRKIRFTQKCLSLHEKFPGNHDQYIINKFLDGTHNELPPQYNIFGGQDDRLLDCTSYIYHFVGSNKPYNISRNHPKQHLWNKYATIHQPNNCINFGILIYHNTNGPASSNIGDYIQSLAAINIYRHYINIRENSNITMTEFLNYIFKNNLPGYNFVFLCRDMLHKTPQSLTNIILIMNGWWLHPDFKNNIKFNIPLNVKPIFISFHIADDRLLSPENVIVFKNNEPIGCRDLKTTNKLLNAGVSAYFSGCLTTTIDFLSAQPEHCMYVVDTKPNHKNMTSVKHCKRKWVNQNPNNCLKDAFDLLNAYSRAKYVLTSRLHCFLPCLAMGVNVDLQSPDGNKEELTWGSKDRFDGLRDLLNDKCLLECMQKELKTECFSKITKILNSV